MKVRLGRIKYINVLPIYYALEKGIIPNDFEFVYGTPSELNFIASKGEVDISSVSSIEYAKNFTRYFLIPDVSIGSGGPVKSVLLKSRVPFFKLHNRYVLVSSQTHTSFALLKMLLKNRFDITPKYVVGSVEYDLKKIDPDGFLAIGDEALRFKNYPEYPYVLDLGEAWQQWTGYPFVFGVWVANRNSVSKHPEIIKEACKKLLESKKWGCERLEFFCKNVIKHSILSEKELISYFKHLVYELNDQEKKGLLFFYKLLYDQNEIPVIPTLSFFSID